MKKRRAILSFLLIFPIWWLLSTTEVSGQDQEICFPVEDAQKLYRIVEEYSIQKREIELLKKQLELTEKESALKDRAIDLEKQRAEIYKSGFDMMRQLVDESLKLSKKTPLEQILEWVIRIALFVFGYFIAK